MPKVKQVAELDDDFDFVDEEEDAVDEVVDKKPSKKKVKPIVIDEGLREAIVEIVNEETQDIREEQKKMAKRMEKFSNALKEQAKVTTTLKTQNEAVLKAMSRIDSSVAIPVDDSPKEDAVDVKEEKGIVGKTLGAIGSVAHGIIDTAAFVLESTVDLVTLGNARK